MRFTSPSRRALGLLAASTIGMSTAVLGVAGVAAAGSDPVLGAGQTVTADGPGGFVVGAGVCSVRWSVSGGQGGAGVAGDVGGRGGQIDVLTVVSAQQEFQLHPGPMGGRASGGTGGRGATNGVSPGGANGVNDSADAGGGGGAGSVVVLVGTNGTQDQVMGAFGGNGGGPGTGGAGEGSALGNFLPDGTSSPSTTTRTGDGQITATGVACSVLLAPGAPVDLQAVGGNGSAALSFDAPSTGQGDAEVTGYEVQVDGGAWAPLGTALNPATGRTEGTVALTNGASHTVAVRAQSTSGPSAAATVAGVVAVTPVQPVTQLTVVPRVTSVLVSWTPPTVQTGVTGYRVFATPVGAQSSQDTVFCDVPVGVSRCLFGVPAGSAYVVGVATLDEAGAEGAFTERQQTPVVTTPSTPAVVPTADDGDMVGPAGPISSVTAGQKLTLLGSGFASNSTVQLTVFSSPVSLGTVVTDGNGAFSVEVTLPANLTDGTHDLVATGINPDGTTRNVVITVTVSGGVATLANTGFGTALPLTGGALALLAGAGMLVGARRRNSN